MADISGFLGLCSFLVVLAGLVALVRPIAALRIPNRTMALKAVGAGILGLMVAGALSPTEAEPAVVAADTTATTTATTAPAQTTTTPPPTTTTTLVQEKAIVVAVVDGDTLQVESASGVHNVRLLGIESPGEGEASGPEASAYLEDLVVGKEVELVAAGRDSDRFGRLLRYVYIGGVFVNQELVRAGLAAATPNAPGAGMADTLAAAEDDAHTAALGIWTATTTAAPPTTTTSVATTTTTLAPTTTTFAPTTTTIVPTTTEAPSANCDQSYPEVCIPPAPPDLDCGEISFRHFAVQGSDPHGFDGDNDGVGCES